MPTIKNCYFCKESDTDSMGILYCTKTGETCPCKECGPPKYKLWMGQLIKYSHDEEEN